MSRLRRLRPPRQPVTPDLRPGLLSVVGLLFLLLPFLLLTTSIQKLTGLELQLAGSTGELTPLPPGQVEAVEVHLRDQTLRIRSAQRTRDVTASQGDVTWSERDLPPREGSMDLSGLQAGSTRVSKPSSLIFRWCSRESTGSSVVQIASTFIFRIRLRTL